MFVRYQDVAALAFNNEKNVSRKAVFFSRQDPYYYTQCTNFRTIFQDLIFKLKIIRPEILQSTDTFLNFKKERKKIEVMEKAIKMSNILLEDYKKELFIDISNISLITSNGDVTRVGYRMEKENKVRYSKKSNEVI